MFSRLKRRLYVFLIIFTGLAGITLISARGQVSAEILFHRAVTISTAQASQTATHSFEFDMPTAPVLGSIMLEYCTNSPSFYLACSAPAGLDVSGAILASQSGNTGFTIDNADSTASKIVLSRTAAAATITHNTYKFTNITNPSNIGSVFVRISTYTSTNATGTYTNNGAVAFAIINSVGFNVGAFVPPFLQLCVGITVAPDCSSISGDSIDLGILSSKHANFGQSQFATATNDPTGYNVYAEGPTMTSGNNIISALTAPTPSFPGTPQFGINLRANLIPTVGQDPVGLGTAAPTLNYNQVNRFMFNSGDSIAASTTTTNYNRMTVSYLVNVPANQPPGVYATTVTYLAVVQF